VANSFFERPILNSPYVEPALHHALDPFGQPLDEEPRAGRRPSQFITPVPQSRARRAVNRQSGFDFGDDAGASSEKQKYDPHPIINEIRSLISSWRNLPNPADWSVTPTTARLLQHWRSDQFEGPRPFFCQLEAVETAIWLTEVARRPRSDKDPKNYTRDERVWAHLLNANAEANPEILRLAMKMATGAGKTTVMAMLIAWQALNAVRTQSSKTFSRGFLIVTPGITIKDRLRVLQPEDPDNYYKTRDIVPPELIGDIGKAKIVITNYHAFKRRETMDVSKVGRSLLQGRDAPPDTIETEGEMLRRACGDLLALKDVVVLNDEAHHCYREKPQSDEEAELTPEDKREAKENSEAARLWISGIEALNRKVGVRTVFDLSATPFFLSGSGYAEGTLFPWVVSDFSLIDAIECGIVKLPRVPVADNQVGSTDTPIYRDLWKHIGKRMPKKGAGKSGDIDPLSIPNELRTALHALYGHYKLVHQEWERAGINVPPVFIVVCNNTATSKLLYEWIAGWDRPNTDGDLVNQHQGHLELFRNYDEHGNRYGIPRTLLIDSAQLESGEALDPAFRGMAEIEIEQFRRELRERTGDPRAGENITDQDLLREVMNTVGKAGRLGESIRCVVSVSMLTEGWDTNTVTHILGVRAFGTQLLCEQVVGRALRRQSYELNEENLFDVEYADIMGIPFDFAAKPVVAIVKPPKPTVRVQAVKDRATLEITFPRVEGYRTELPHDLLEANFTDDSRFELNPERIGPCTVLLEGIVGEGNELKVSLDDIRPSTIAFHIAKHILYTRFRDHGEDPPLHLFGQLRTIVRRWVDEGWLVAKGVPIATITYHEMAEEAANRIYNAIQRGSGGEKRIKAVLDAYNPKGSSRFVSFNTSKDTWRTDARRSHVNYVVMDSSWEGELARCIERNKSVRAYVKNQGLGFEVPYRDGAVARKYLPDFVVQLETGEAEPLHLILETKGYRGKDAQAKADTITTLWVPGVNNLGTFGRWAFAEFTEPYDIEAKFDALVETVLSEQLKEKH